MYNDVSNIVIGFHGCDECVRDAVLNGEMLKPSQNEYDWLGHGIYFWENDPQRAMQWAIELSQKEGSSIKKPAVIGAVIQLGKCFDLAKNDAIKMLKTTYDALEKSYCATGLKLPQNKNVVGSNDLLLRYLDCSVINFMHEVVLEDSFENAFDTVRGYFTEGKQIYPTSGFYEKTHIQICVRNTNCIKGFFLPREKERRS